MHIHGGGFALTNAESYPWLIGYELVRRTGSVVLFPDYQRPPQARFGEEHNPLSDLLRLYKQLVQFYGAENILMMGDSAGGNLAMATLISVVKERLPAPAGLVLISPWVDLTTGSVEEPSFAENEGTDILPKDLVLEFASMYCKKNDRKDPLISPVFAHIDELKQFPPTMLTYGGGEVFKSQEERLQERLSAAEVLREVYVASGMPHVSPLFAPALWGVGMPVTDPPPPAVEALQKIVEFAATAGFSK
jgi:acetyl esterase/lipase